MVLVTNSATIDIMLKNIITYLETYITDPDPTGRSNATVVANDRKFVKIKDGRSENYPPHIYVELPSGGSPATTTGILNRIRNPRFGIHIHHTSQNAAKNMADNVYDELVKLNADFFSDSKMFPTVNGMSEPEFQEHETIQGHWYAKIYVTFEYFHYIG